MALSVDDVRVFLDPDEPDYERVRNLGPDALSALAQLVQGTDAMLASKAAYAAGVIGTPAAVTVLEHAARSAVPAVRVAAAAAVGELTPELGAGVLLELLADGDSGVRRQALSSTGGRSDPALRSRIVALSRADPVARLRAMASAELGRPSKRRADEDDSSQSGRRTPIIR